MIESIENTIQLVLTGICAFIALYRAWKTKEHAWVFLGLFSGIFFLGDLYWLLFLVFYDKTPQFTNISDLSWDTSYLFLFLLLLYIRGGSFKETVWPQLRRNWFLWCVPVFTVGMCVFFITRGEVLNNIIIAVLMTGLILQAINGLLIKKRERRMLYLVTLLFCLVEYALWVSSCFWMGDTIANVYYWFDLILSVTFVLFLPALRKAVDK